MDRGWEVCHDKTVPADPWTDDTSKEDLELEALLRVGSRRRNRWFNERLLRDLAGPMDAEDMKSQYAPPPFGFVAPPSSLILASHSRHRDAILTMDMDDEMDLLEAWEAQKAPSRLEVPCGANSNYKIALQAWSRVAPKARTALRRCSSVAGLQHLETPLLNLLRNQTSNPLCLALPDSFQRMLIHGLCDFHGLVCHSVTQLNGERVTYVKIRSNIAETDIVYMTCSEFINTCLHQFR
eukprot:CAMPEP_0196582134 /NCGR_PEP_ID=MMETSP1081-20130531/37616_1 /TAXON_ID=36882 /ORGANISM="Pyramimonas amylifera, Strain CCMP720" /LENGTH=237 /DNA_ID=CAMNT_0041902617 /DNA_START=202 /DNA_END=912 /DNA_ORIENTATION=-